MPGSSGDDVHARGILEFYFGRAARADCDLETFKERTKYWFFRNPDTDATIRARFENDVERAARGELDSWKATASGRLALIVLLDQFPRNIHRESPRAFEHQKQAEALALEGLELGDDEELSAPERLVFYLPLMHAEDIALQRRSCELYGRLAEQAPTALRPELDSAYQFAQRHRGVVERFGRFPHRNRALGRTPTREEIEFLKEPGSSF